MPITRCSDQKSQTLATFYNEWAEDKNPISSEIGKSMLLIIDFINDTFSETIIYGLTSHTNLLLLAKDSYQTPWFVVVIANGKEFHIEYKTESSENVIIKKVTDSFEEFKKNIIIAMHHSQGWNGSNELNKLFQNINLK